MENSDWLRLVGMGVASMASGPRKMRVKPQKLGGIFVSFRLAEKISGLDTIGIPLLPDKPTKKEYVPSKPDVFFQMFYSRQTEIS